MTKFLTIFLVALSLNIGIVIAGHVDGDDGDDDIRTLDCVYDAGADRWICAKPQDEKKPPNG